MPPNIPNQVNQSPSKPSHKKWIVIGVVIVAVLAGLQFLASTFLTPAKLMEMAIEHETGADIDITRDGSTMRGTGPDGEAFELSTGADVSLPEEWPSTVPVMEGGRIISSAAVGQGSDQGMFVVLETSRSASDVLSFYKEELGKQGFVSQGEMNSAQTSVVSFVRNDEEVAIMVGKGAGGKGNSVQITYKNQP